MKNHKQLLADFYLDLLAIPTQDRFRILNMNLYASVRAALAKELREDEEAIQRIFEKMVLNDINRYDCYYGGARDNGICYNKDIK